MKSLFSRFAILLMVCCTTRCLHAQPQNFFFRHLSQAGGLSAVSINAITQDQYGFLWIGTFAGLNRYDGYDFTVYSTIPGDSTSLSHNTIFSLLETRDGTLWVGTEHGLNRLDPTTGRFTRFLNDPGNPYSISNNEVTALAEDQEGMLWVGTQHGLNRLDPTTGRFTRFLNDPDQQPTGRDAVSAIYVDTESTLWAATSDGLTRLEPSTGAVQRFLAADVSLPPSILHRGSEELFIAVPNRINHVFNAVLERPESPGILWLTGRGLTRLDTHSGHFERFLPDESTVPGSTSDIDSNLMVDIVQDPHQPGRLWITTYRGLLCYDIETARFTRYHSAPEDPNSLSSDLLLALYVDRTGLIWVGTENSMLHRFDPSNPGFFNYRSGPEETNYLPLSGVRGIAEDSTGALWIAMPSSGLIRFDRTSNTYKHWPLNAGNGSLHGNPFPLLIDRSGTIWVGTFGASEGNNLFSLNADGKTFTPYVVGSSVWSLYEDQSGFIWVGMEEGFGWIDPETGTYSPFPDKEGQDMSIRAIFEDRSGRIWVGNWLKGLGRMDRNMLDFVWYEPDSGNPNSLNHIQINAIYERAQEPDVLWIGTHGGGLDRFDTRSGIFQHHITQDGLPHNVVYGILEDKQGNLWLSTNRGIARFIPDSKTFISYGLEHDLQSLEFNRVSYYQSPYTGEMFFGGIYGLNAFQPSDIRENTVPPQVALTGLNLFNHPVISGPNAPIQVPIQLAEEITLSPDQDMLTFEFAALHFVYPQKNRYQYRLAGYNDAWVDAGTQRTATYTNLPPGLYTFQVKAANSDGVWNEEGASIRLTVLPPWWRTTWAYVLYGLCFIAMLFIIDRTQRRRLIRQERERAMNRELEQARQIEAMNVKLRQNEQQLEEQNQKLLELDHAKSRFFANISHEFRTPLTLILGPVKDMLDEADTLPRPHRTQLSLMQRNGQRLLRLINQLLDLARLDAGRLTLLARKTDLVPLVKATVQAFASLAERRRIILQVDTPEHEVPLYVETDKLEKVLFNLLSNAFKFTPDEGRIEVHIQEHAKAVDIVIHDTGRGIPNDTLSTIFERFTTRGSDSWSQEQEGAGIGLALTKELVELHGGTIRVESTPGVGTTFYVSLPKGKAHLQEEQMVVDESVAVSGDGIPDFEQKEFDQSSIPSNITTDADDTVLPDDAPVILIVEDNDDVRTYLRSHLASSYRIVEAVDGLAGLEQAHTLKPDLVLSDVMMPGLDGYDLCRAIKSDENLHHIPVVLLTARADDESKLAGLQTGADDYLYKPFNAEELMLRVENLIEIRRRLRVHFSQQVVVKPVDVSVPSADAAFLEEVQRVVEAEMSDSHFSVERLAEALHLSPRQLRRRLRELIRLSPSGYIRTMRLQRAAQLLEQEVGRVSEVAYAVGFSDPNYFSKLFQQVFGVAPSQYLT